MRRFLTCCVLTAALTISGTLAYGQWGARGGPYQPTSVSSLISRVHSDLDRGYRVWGLSGGDRDRLTHAEHQLRDFDKQWRRGKFDKGELDESIGAIQHVLDKNHLNGRERDVLWEDVTRLRQMREAYDRHEIGRW